MKLSALPLVVAGAGLLQVNASPLRVLFISSESLVKNETLPPSKFHQMEHALAGDKNRTRKGCAGSRFPGQKSQSFSFSISISNTLRQVLGMPLIETDFLALSSPPHMQGHHLKDFHDHIKDLGDNEEGRHHRHPHHEMAEDGEDHVHRKHHSHHHDHHEQPEGEMNMQEDGEGRVRHKHHHHHHDEMQSMEDGQEGPVRHKHHHKHHFHGKGSFMKRIHLALMSLGPWEGRAVAFVLGCGLGVLLRMLWVLSVVTFRTIRGSRQEQEDSYDYIPVLNQLDAEEIFVAPPVYILDEKAPIEDESKAANATIVVEEAN